MASYFDILFAVNELPHPGEKRLINICINQCKLLPANFESNLNQLFNDLFITKEKVMADIDILIFELKKIIA